MRRLNIPKKEIEKLTEVHKQIATKFAFEWNPLGNSDVFRDIQEDVFNYILKRNHNLSKQQINMIEKEVRKSQK